jgi:hypothetical protein
LFTNFLYLSFSPFNTSFPSSLPLSPPFFHILLELAGGDGRGSRWSLWFRKLEFNGLWKTRASVVAIAAWPSQIQQAKKHLWTALPSNILSSLARSKQRQLLQIRPHLPHCYLHFATSETTFIYHFHSHLSCEWLRQGLVGGRQLTNMGCKCERSADWQGSIIQRGARRAAKGEQRGERDGEGGEDNDKRKKQKF